MNPEEEAVTKLEGGVKIFGGWSRANPQRSLSIFARSRYGADEMEYPFFFPSGHTLSFRHSYYVILATIMGGS